MYAEGTDEEATNGATEGSERAVVAAAGRAEVATAVGTTGTWLAAGSGTRGAAAAEAADTATGAGDGDGIAAAAATPLDDVGAVFCAFGFI